MAKLNFDTRDELISLDLDLLAAVQASGSYSRAVYINKREFMLTVNISKVEEALNAYRPKGYRFIRLGRSVIINHRMLTRIELTKQILLLSDGDKNDIRVRIPKKILRQYKEAVASKGTQL